MSSNERTVRILCIVLLMVNFTDGFYISQDNDDRINYDDVIDSKEFLADIIKSLQNNQFRREENSIRPLSPRQYSAGSYVSTPEKRNYGINPPFHEICRMLKMPYCTYRS